jgi:hypothetical protein
MEIKLTDLLGYSILSENLKSFMGKYDLSTNPKEQLDTQGNAYDTSSDNNKLGIYLNFDGYYRYKREFGEPTKRYKNSKNELFLNEITIDSDFLKTKKTSIVDLPFGLQIGDDKQIILSKLKKKPYEKSPNSYGHCWWTRFDDFRILTALSPEFKLIWVRIMKLSSDEKEKIKLKKYLSQQNKNINPENQNLILELEETLPTNYWKKRKNEGDDSFTDERINSVENLIKDYLKTLVELTTKKKASNIYNSVKKVVSSLNKINSKNDYFIETMEREELCEFINNAVRKTGIQIDQEIDLTEEWREW